MAARERCAFLVKRCLDVAGAALGLVLLSPALAAIAVAVRITHGAPVLFRQQRPGLHARSFTLLKFRTMRPPRPGEVWFRSEADRLTRLGRFLRTASLDELPELWNVLRGDMSLVGPRPERPVFVERFRAALPDYDLRHAVPSGMTGWAQVHGWRGRTSLRKRIQYDLDYIQRWSFGLDFRILLMTVQHVVWGKTSWVGPKRRAGN